VVQPPQGYHKRRPRAEGGSGRPAYAPDVPEMRRIAIVGPTAAGKSTLARRLGDALGLPVHHLDALYWRPGWQAMPPDEWEALLGDLVGQARWIVDGNFTASMRDRLEAADTLVFVDLPRRVCLVRAVRRRAAYARRRAPGTADQSRPHFDLRLLRWIWTFPSDHRPLILDLFAELGEGRSVHVLRTRRAVERFAAGVERAAAR
jgi:adenylate kinase family enzyme